MDIPRIAEFYFFVNTFYLLSGLRPLTEGRRSFVFYQCIPKRYLNHLYSANAQREDFFLWVGWQESSIDPAQFGQGYGERLDGNDLGRFLDLFHPETGKWLGC